MKKFPLIFQISSKNWITLLYFEILYKTFGFSVVFPCLRYLLSLLPRLSGVEYLGQDNIVSLFTEPPALLMGLGILILAASYITYEILVFIVLSEAGWRHERMTVLRLIKQSAVKSFTLLRPNRIGVFSLLIILTLSAFSPVSGYLKMIRFPDFLWEYIRVDAGLFLLYAGILASFHVLLFLYIFGLPAMLLSNRTFLGSWRESLELLRGQTLRTAKTVIVLNLWFPLLLAVLALASCLGLVIYSKWFHMAEGRLLLAVTLISWQNVGIIAGSALASSFLWGTIVVLYHEGRDELPPQVPGKKLSLKGLLFHTASMAALLSLLFLFTETEISGRVLPSLSGRPSIIAHRAGAGAAPENTVAALHQAIEDGSDAVEIDVQQLGDGTLIVMHDSNFKRTTGLDLDVWDADGKSIQEPVPTLEEFLIHAKGRCRLMLELKATGHDSNVEQQVLSLIQTYGMEKQCMIASMDLSILKKVKELSPDMETVYISVVLITRQYDLSFVDGYSVEITSLSRGMTLQAHFQNKKVYAWTVNSDHSVKKGLRCGVDGLITDTPLAAGLAVEKYGDSPLAKYIVNLFYEDGPMAAARPGTV